MDIFNIDGDLNNFTDGTIILGKQLAIELGVVVGDRINIMSSSSMTTLFGAVPKQSNYKIIIPNENILFFSKLKLSYLFKYFKYFLVIIRVIYNFYN